MARAGAHDHPHIPPVGDDEGWPDEFGAGPDADFDIGIGGSGPGSLMEEGLGLWEADDFFGTE